MNKLPVINYGNRNDRNFKIIQFKKILEEINELELALTFEDNANILEECLDVIQTVLSIVMLYDKGSISKALECHDLKLKERKWNIEKYLTIIDQKFCK
jgi:phosphoribosyl-ATP pyrophosphohydrolase